MIVPITTGYMSTLGKVGFSVDQKWLLWYNINTMKTQQNTRKTRAHIVLFLNNTPFKPQRVELKTRYQRQEKHRNRVDLG